MIDGVFLFLTDSSNLFRFSSVSSRTGGSAVSDIHSEVLASVTLRAALPAGLNSDLTWDVNFTFSFS